jgi:hypothetical protein
VWILLFIALVLGLVAVLLMFRGVHLNPSDALVVVNNFTGELSAFSSPGLHIIGPHQREVAKVTLRDEPFERTVEVTTADPLALQIRYVVRPFRVQADAQSIVKVASTIDYSRRKEVVQASIDASLQAECARRRIADAAKSGVRGVDDWITEVEELVNGLSLGPAARDWGIEGRVRVAQVVLPGVITAAAATALSATDRASATSVRAQTGGAPPWVVELSDALATFSSARRNDGA